jgi:digeranylgeranylglycerophospholipid reductase
MKDYDVIIIGAGPAGGECARRLSQQGASVLLAEKNADFSVNSYSSAGAPNEILEQFRLPEKVVGTRWHSLNIHSSNKHQKFTSSSPRGVVMDFTKLKQFLAEETINQGSHVKLGHQYLSHAKEHSHIRVQFKNASGKTEEARGKILVDATGSERQVLAKRLNNHPESFTSTGIELLLNTPPEVYEKWAHALSFFMGHRWMPQGYAWIFPMGPNLLKVGVGRYFQREQVVPHKNSYTFYLTGLIKECLGPDNYPLIDRHGKSIIYTYRQKDPHFEGPVIAIGDSVSSINPLAFEGIRHAMKSGDIAAGHILKKLESPSYSFSRYQKEQKKYYGYKWWICERLMYFIYRTPKDENIDDMVSAYKTFSFNDIIALGFFYDYRRALKFIWEYGKARGKRILKK